MVGKVDIYKTIPIEVKTTSNLAGQADLRHKRPGYIEQLGMYCGMVNVGNGKIVIYQRDTPRNAPPALVVYDVKFSYSKAIREEIVRRQNLLE